VTGAIAGATGGGSLLADALWGAAANVAGGIVTRTAEGDDADEVFSGSDIAVDVVSGLVVVVRGMLRQTSFTFLKILARLAGGGMLSGVESSRSMMPELPLETEQ
jgi:hypothetical protein